MPNTTEPDPNWGKCLQCAALDRARLKLNPPPRRSDTCTRCFMQYCYDPNQPPSASEVPSRDYVYKNPDPGGVNKVEEFLSRNKDAIIGGAVGVSVLIASGIAFMCVSSSRPWDWADLARRFWWRKRRERKNRYSRVHELREDDEPWKFYGSYHEGHEVHQLSLL